MGTATVRETITPRGRRSLFKRVVDPDAGHVAEPGQRTQMPADLVARFIKVADNENFAAGLSQTAQAPQPVCEAARVLLYGARLCLRIFL